MSGGAGCLVGQAAFADVSAGGPNLLHLCLLMSIPDHSRLDDAT